MSNVQIVKDLYDAFAKGDIAGVLGAMAPDIAWSEAEGNPYEPAGAPWVGPDAIVENLFSKIPTDWEFFTVHMRSIHDAGDTVIAEGRYNAKHNATGKPLDAQVCHIWTLRDGKITRFQQYVDTAHMQDVMGAVAAR